MSQRPRLWPARLLLVLAGALIEWLATPPGPAPALIAAFDAPFLILLWHGGGRGWARWSYLYGLVRYVTGLRWLAEVHWTMAIGAPAILAAGQVAYGAALRFLAARRMPFPLAVGVCAVLLEMLQTVIQGASGMPWPARSLAFTAWAPMVGAAALLGAYGLSFLAGASSAIASALPGLLRRDGLAGARARALALPAIAVALAWALAGTWGGLESARVRDRMEGPSPEMARTAPIVVVQGNVPQSLKNERQDPGHAQRIFDAHVALTADALARLADERRAPIAVLWPETMIPWPMMDPGLARAFPEDWRNQHVILQNLQSLLRPGASPPLLLGASRYFVGRKGPQTHLLDHDQTDGLLFADVSAVPPEAPFPPEGATSWTPPWERGWHHKTLLVPWGEYTPGGSWLPPLRDLRDEVSIIPEITPGPPDQEPFLLGIAPPAHPGGPNREVRAGTIICFEIAFPARCRAWRRSGATVLLNAGNYAWYGDSDMPAQVEALGRLRAAELAVTVVIAGNTGPSCLIDPSGAVREQVRVGGRTQYVAGWCAGPLWCDPDLWTPYARWGDAPWWLVGAALFVVALFRRRHRLVTGFPGPGAGTSGTSAPPSPPPDSASPSDPLA